MAKHLTDQQALDNARTLVENLRTIRADALRQLDEFTVYVERLAEAVENARQGKEGAENMRSLSSAVFAQRAMEKVDDLVNLHKGGTSGMHVREFQHNMLGAVAGEALELPFHLAYPERGKKG